MKTMTAGWALLLAGAPCALAQGTFDFSAVLNGTETVQTWNALTDDFIDTVTPYSTDLYVVVSENFLPGGSPYGTLSIDGGTLPQVINWPTSGPPSFTEMLAVGDEGSATYSVSSSGATSFKGSYCGATCEYLAATGTGTWSGPAGAAPELSGEGAAGALTLTFGMLLVAGRKQRLR